jgi:transcriptional regulator of acetoin/glycerol metabolism
LIASDRAGTLRLTADAAEALLLHHWPYNVRELLSVLDNLRAGRTGSDAVGLLSLPRDVRACLESRRVGEPAAPAAVPASRENLAELLRACDGNVAEVARRLGKDRKQVYRWMAREGLESEERTVTGKGLPRDSED